MDEVVGRAIGIADSDGLPAVTMRNLADALGMAPMNIYRYVPSRSVLVDLMFDQICIRQGSATLRRDSLADSVRAIADRNRQLFESHPWAASVGISRPSLGPGQSGKYERELEALCDWNLDDVEMDASLSLVIGFVRSNFRDAVDQQAAITDSGISDADWWQANAPLLAELIDPGEFPLATRIGKAAGEAHGASVEAGFSYRFGLDRIVAGIVELASGKR